MQFSPQVRYYAFFLFIYVSTGSSFLSKNACWKYAKADLFRRP